MDVPGYLALPKSGHGSGIVVLHAWWGLNDFIRRFCERLAAEGYVAFAPDLYHGEIAATIEEADHLSSNLNREVADREMVAAVQFLRDHPAVSPHSLSVIGFSLGVFLGLSLAQNRPQDIRTAVLFYGSGDGMYDKTQAIFQGHFAENDPYEPAESIQNLERDLLAAGRALDFHTYPGTGHWFFEDDRPDAYDPAAATTAWERTLAFLREYLTGTIL